MAVNLRRYMETHWQYYVIKVRGGSHDGRWLQPMLRETTPQWSDDNGETLVHLYCGNLPATAPDSDKSWWLLEVKSPSAPGDVWWKVLARRDSFLEGPDRQQMQWDSTERAECVVTAELTHTTGYETVFDAQDTQNCIVLTSHDGRLASSRSLMHRRIDLRVP